MEVDSMEIENKKSHESTAPQGTSIPHFQDQKNKGDYFSLKLKEIDKDLGIYNQLMLRELIPIRKLHHSLTWKI